MSGQLTEQDRIKLARAAKHIHRMTEEADRANQERESLARADDATLRAILDDRALPTLARLNALMALMGRDHLRRFGTLSGIMLPLWDDPDEELARMAIEYAPPNDPEVTARLHSLLDDPRSNRWSTAASVLAGRRRDTAIIPRLIGWFREGDEAHRNVAYSCLCFYRLLGPDECRTLLREAWYAGGRDDDRAMLAVGLLGLGDRVGWTFLVEFAREADHYSACWAAETILEHDPALGLDLMLHILDHGTTFQVRWGMVEKIAKAAGLPHLWTADGLAEARFWVEQQRQNLKSECAVSSLASLQALRH